MEVRVREGRAVNIHMFCARRPGLLLSTMRVLDCLGLDIQQAVISCFNGFALDVFRAEVSLLLTTPNKLRVCLNIPLIGSSLSDLVEWMVTFSLVQIATTENRGLFSHHSPQQQLLVRYDAQIQHEYSKDMQWLWQEHGFYT